MSSKVSFNNFGSCIEKTLKICVSFIFIPFIIHVNKHLCKLPSHNTAFLFGHF